MNINLNIDSSLVIGIAVGAAVVLVAQKMVGKQVGEEMTLLRLDAVTDIAEPEEVDYSEWFEEEDGANSRPFRLGFTS